MKRSVRTPLTMLLALPPLLAAPGCASTDPPPPPEVRAGQPDRGAALIAQYGCGSCHTIPGINRADGLVGPPLTRFGSRSYIAGKLVNNADNLQHWIADPQAVEPGTAMPDLGVSPLDAQDIAAYLYTLD
ncbi:c-type cytochrome [Micromonospora sp. NPDC050495]|uniref:c-type cytochrome n=1 Tax=Micromonospora sp. NPDC050495 TaxID=3154936 RepID=UPI0033CC85D3